jgi:hypothetical protein
VGLGVLGLPAAGDLLLGVASALDAPVQHKVRKGVCRIILLAYACFNPPRR